MNSETLTCIAYGGGSVEGPSSVDCAEGHDAIKRFEIEILLNAGGPNGRVAEIAGESPGTVHRIRVAEVKARSTAVTATTNTLFQVVSERHRRARTMVFTTNKPFEQRAVCCKTRISPKPFLTQR